MGRQLYTCLVAVGPRVVDARTKCSKARCRAQTDDFYGQGCKGGLIMGKGKAHIRWWGRSDCNFSVVLETSSRQSQLEASTGPPLRSRARMKGG